MFTIFLTANIRIISEKEEFEKKNLDISEKVLIFAP